MMGEREREREQSWNTCKPSPGTHIVSSMDEHTHKDDIKGETHIHKDDGGEREREREQSWNTCKPSPGTHIVSSMDVHTSTKMI